MSTVIICSEANFSNFVNLYFEREIEIKCILIHDIGLIQNIGDMSGMRYLVIILSGFWVVAWGVPCRVVVSTVIRQVVAPG